MPVLQARWRIQFAGMVRFDHGIGWPLHHSNGKRELAELVRWHHRCRPSVYCPLHRAMHRQRGLFYRQRICGRSTARRCRLRSRRQRGCCDSKNLSPDRRIPTGSGHDGAGGAFQGGTGLVRGQAGHRLGPVTGTGKPSFTEFLRVAGVRIDYNRRSAASIIARVHEPTSDAVRQKRDSGRGRPVRSGARPSSCGTPVRFGCHGDATSFVARYRMLLDTAYRIAPDLL